MKDEQLVYRAAKIRITSISGCYKRCTISFRLMAFRKDFNPVTTDESIFVAAKSFIDHLQDWKI